MPKKFNILILGPDTDIGQSIMKIINDHFHYLNVATPTGIYKEGSILPPNQIAMNFSNAEKLGQQLKMAEVVVSCALRYSTDEIQNIAKENNVKFVNGCCSYPQAVIEAAFQRLPFQPTSMSAIQTASGTSIIDFWHISHNETGLSAPTLYNNKWCIEQESVPLEGLSVKHRLEFNRKISAYIFWICALISRFIFPFFKKSSAYRSLSSWRFTGKCYEHNQKYKFKAYSEKVDAEILRPDLAMLKILDGLGISRSDSHDWGCCTKMKVKLEEYVLWQQSNSPNKHRLTSSNVVMSKSSNNLKADSF